MNKILTKNKKYLLLVMCMFIVSCGGAEKVTLKGAEPTNISINESGGNFAEGSKLKAKSNTVGSENVNGDLEQNTYKGEGVGTRGVK